MEKCFPRHTHSLSSSRRFAPPIEALEPRRLLSATLTQGLLSVTGTKGDDTISIAADRTRLVVQLNGETRRYKLSAVRSIRVNGGSGDDVIRLKSASKARIGTTLLGGAGNDRIMGSPGQDWIEGGVGNDQISGGAGHDQIYGDNGDDTLTGGAGNDSLGGDGEDRLWFHGVSNRAAKPGNDVLSGGSGNDYLVGGPESDTFHGQPNGRDTLTGGSGTDILDARTRYTYPNGVRTPDAATADVITDRQTGEIVPEENYHKPGTDYAVHLHALLRIYINDNGTLRQVLLPNGIGDFNQKPVFHKHDDTDTLHLHDMVVRDFTLGEFFRNWGITFDANHIGRYRADATHPLTMTVNGQKNTDFANYVIQDRDRITIRFATNQGADPRYPDDTAQSVALMQAAALATGQPDPKRIGAELFADENTAQPWSEPANE